MKMNYYAKINSDSICEQIIATPKVLKMSDHIEIDNYNDTLLWRKWEDGNWSEKTFVPDVDPNIQERLDAIDSLELELKNKEATIATLVDKVAILSDTLDFLIAEGGM